MTDNHSLEAWKQAIGPQEYEVERGAPPLLLRRVGLMDLIEQGQIPDLLTGQAVKLASAGLTGKTWSLDELKEFIGVVNVVVKACSVSPQITDEGGEDSLAVGDIPFIWRVKVFNWAGESVGPLRRFRGEQSGNVKVVEFLQNLQKAAESTSGD